MPMALGDTCLSSPTISSFSPRRTAGSEVMSDWLASSMMTSWNDASSLGSCSATRKYPAWHGFRGLKRRIPDAAPVAIGGDTGAGAALAHLHGVLRQRRLGPLGDALLQPDEGPDPDELIKQSPLLGLERRAPGGDLLERGTIGQAADVAGGARPVPGGPPALRRPPIRALCPVVGQGVGPDRRAGGVHRRGNGVEPRPASPQRIDAPRIFKDTAPHLRQRAGRVSDPSRFSGSQPSGSRKRPARPL